jgi:class 3 adenylate cyclase
VERSGPGDRPAGSGGADELTSNPGVIATTVLSGVIAVVVAAAEWVGSGEALGSPAGILWSVVALLGVAATLLGFGLELRRRRQAEQEQPAPGRSAGRELPTGTVTFLFTDIEGSTRLLQDLGDRYLVVRDEHAAILRRAIRDGDGVEVGTEGDSFFAAFPSPVAAVQAAVAAQRGLATHRWPTGFPVRVRMGLHTGEGVLGGDNYVGIDVNRAARVAGAAAGGQVIVSGATRGLVAGALPEGTALRDLGEHRLRDINLPLHLHDLVIAGLPADFPPPRTLDASPGNLPGQLTSFVGREDEIDEAVRLLGRTRLLTLTGPGGTGKSRLALQVADRVRPGYRDGAFFVDLSAVPIPPWCRRWWPGPWGSPRSPGGPCPTPWPTTCATGSSCSWWTTSSRWWRPGRCSSGCSAPPPGCGCWSPPGSRCRSGASRSWWCRRWPCPTRSGPWISSPSAGPRPSGCSSSGPGPSAPSSG